MTVNAAIKDKGERQEKDRKGQKKDGKKWETKREKMGKQVQGKEVLNECYGATSLSNSKSKMSAARSFINNDGEPKVQSGEIHVVDL